MFFPFPKKEKKPESLEDLINFCQNQAKELEKLRKELQDFKKEGESFFQKFAVLRFNPFSNQGGDQSFSIAFLNGKNNGVIITSLYNKGDCKIYAKPVKEGKATKPLSKEESEVLKKALENEN
jgi:hypothetical protein